jgi:hypothetical protein
MCLNYEILGAQFHGLISRSDNRLTVSLKDTLTLRVTKLAT